MVNANFSSYLRIVKKLKRYIKDCHKICALELQINIISTESVYSSSQQNSEIKPDEHGQMFGHFSIINDFKNHFKLAPT